MDNKNIKPIPIEVKYPYDSEKYTGTRNWDKLKRKYYVCLYLKKEYKNKNTLKKEIRRPINIYIAETEIINRFLNDDEKVIFIDNDKLNYNKDNLKVMKKGEVESSIYPIGEIPFQDYYIGKEKKHENGSICVTLYHINDITKRTKITRSKYRLCLKLGRKLKDNEKLVYIDDNRLNDDINNLTYIVLEQAEYPFDEYYIGKIYEDNKDERMRIQLKHKTNPEKKLSSMYYSRYRKQVMEGRIFERWEEVDHIDANPYNDSDNNLQILTTVEHRKKTIQEQIEMTPNTEIICSGCDSCFNLYIPEIISKLKYGGNKLNNLFCSRKCKSNYKSSGNEIEYKKLIKYTCVSTGKVFKLPENIKILPSKFNPDALPFYTWDAVSKWIKEKNMKEKNKNKSIRIIAIDPGTNLAGYSVIEQVKNKKLKIIEVGELKRRDVYKAYLRKNKIKYIDEKINIFLAYEMAFKNIFDKYDKIDAIIIEGAFNKRFLLSFLALSTLKLFIEKAAYESKKLSLIELAPKYVKKYITGTGNADKDDMKKSLLKYKTLIKKGLKIKELSEHEIDAICIGITYIENYKKQ